ncbi:MAG: hypothetical protein J1F28_01145 [Oscillospiraceae bacterium]|nr:hypothetical protein [Oscillospiraceae bacterium]
MKTVLIDNSLCVSALRDGASAEDICGYIKALASAGIKYVELDFRVLMKLRELPKGIGYIFRVVDPMFIQISDAFKFDYVVMTFADLKKNISSKTPVMLELPYVENTYRGVLRYAQAQTSGMVTAIRFCDDFGYRDLEETKRFVSRIKNNVPLPVDFCPRNTRRTALDCALKFTFSGADSLTLSVPRTNLFASLEEYAVSFLSVYDTLPKGFDIYEFFGAVYYYRRIFKNSENADIMKLFETLDWDIRMMRNADTGEKTKFNIALKSSNMLRKNFVSSLEKMLARENLESDEFETLVDAVKYFDASVCSDDVIYDEHRGLLN